MEGLDEGVLICFWWPCVHEMQVIAPCSRGVDQTVAVSGVDDFAWVKHGQFDSGPTRARARGRRIAGLEFQMFGKSAFRTVVVSWYRGRRSLRKSIEYSPLSTGWKEVESR